MPCRSSALWSSRIGVLARLPMASTARLDGHVLHVDILQLENARQDGGGRLLQLPADRPDFESLLALDDDIGMSPSARCGTRQ